MTGRFVECDRCKSKGLHGVQISFVKIGTKADGNPMWRVINPDQSDHAHGVQQPQQTQQQQQPKPESKSTSSTTVWEDYRASRDKDIKAMHEANQKSQKDLTDSINELNLTLKDIAHSVRGWQSRQ